MGPPAAVLDANVLYPQFLRDVLLRLAAAELFVPRWTDRIQDEWTRNLLRDRPDLTPERLANTHRHMARAFPEAQVAGYAHLEARFGGVHPKDRHGAAAALASGATHIVTWNRRDFPAEALAPHGIEAADPDAFVSALLDWAGDVAVTVLERHRAGLLKPPHTWPTYKSALRAAGLVTAAERLP